MKKQKQPSDVRGHFTGCVNFVKCPICYGCRAYRSDIPDCQECMKNSKRDICNTNLHKSDVIANMVLKEKIKIDNVEFKSK